MTGPLVTLEVCRVRPRDVPRLVASGRRVVRRRRREPGVVLAKLLATTGRRFVPGDVQPTRWALLTCRSDGQPAATWRSGSATLHLRPVASRGRWDGVDPFPDSAGEVGDGPVAVLTRATLRARHLRRFYADVPAVAAEVGSRPVLAFGFGEAPVLRQGTFSIWESAPALAAFHRDARAHTAAMRRTPRIGWYAEELFARLAVVQMSGPVEELLS
ncbi:MAG: spheroidene monooxygenase [Frankiaceae bacterium]|nr:spheroidene monooxygenase [Frankiaceae bacterium]MBV9369563.1 spheroidene monooxygenase [Frankiales bacterium]